MKTQILITDIPKCKFEQNWPQLLQTQLFNGTDAKFKYGSNEGDDVTVFTPLKSLHRIFIMCTNEKTALKLYHYLQDHPNINGTNNNTQSNQCNGKMHVYLTNSMLKSFSSQSSISTTSSSLNTATSTSTPPVLTVDTEGIEFMKKHKSCNTCSDGSLSPVTMDYSPGGHPVKMKRIDTGEYVYYNEPKPNKSRSNSSLLSINNSNSNLRGLNINSAKDSLNKTNQTSNPFIVINDAS
ncbi:hypothetical protein ACO0RG_002862 [Hanseniaspora osmophila]